MASGSHRFLRERRCWINNDGSNKQNSTSPNLVSQKNLIQESIRLANIKPEDISFIETHGTGIIIFFKNFIKNLTY